MRTLKEADEESRKRFRLIQAARACLESPEAIYPPLPAGVLPEHGPNSPAWDYLTPSQRHAHDLYSNRVRHGGWLVLPRHAQGTFLTRRPAAWGAERFTRVAGIWMPDRVEADDELALVRILVSIQEEAADSWD